MPIWYNYTIILPLQEEYKDDGTRDLFSIPIEVEGVGRFEASAIGNEDHVELLRVATLNSDGLLSQSQQESVVAIKSHLLAVLRITYDIDIQEFRQGTTFLGIGTKDVNGRPSLNVSLKVHNNQGKIDTRNIQNTFLATSRIQPLIVLIGDVQNGSLPLQYRYLSLYKAFELEFRPAGKWADLKKVFIPISSQYEAKKAKDRSLVARFHELRDSCAHIRTGSKDKLGLVGLFHPDARDVELLLPLLTGVLIEHVTNKYPPLRLVQRKSSS